MADRSKVVIVASNQAMRASLAFLLEAEGYAVAAMERLDVESHPDDQAAVVIIDQDALADRVNPVAELTRLNRPAVLLVERMRQLPALQGLQIVEKPPLGRDLLDAVAAALGQARST